MFKIDIPNSSGNHPFSHVMADNVHIAEIARTLSVHLGRVIVTAHSRDFRVYTDGVCTRKWNFADHYTVNTPEEEQFEREVIVMHENADLYEARTTAKKLGL